jgi:hypothetical protein
LIGLFGDQYRRYRRQIPMLIPWLGRGGSGGTAGAPSAGPERT